jgi:hypothetical protein
MGTAAGAKKAREVRALKRRMRVEREDRPDIVTFVTDPRYLGRSIGARLSVAQRTLLKGCYGLPLTDDTRGRPEGTSRPTAWATTSGAGRESVAPRRCPSSASPGAALAA